MHKRARAHVVFFPFSAVYNTYVSTIRPSPWTRISGPCIRQHTWCKEEEEEKVGEYSEYTEKRRRRRRREYWVARLDLLAIIQDGLSYSDGEAGGPVEAVPFGICLRTSVRLECDVWPRSGRRWPRFRSWAGGAGLCQRKDVTGCSEYTWTKERREKEKKT